MHNKKIILILIGLVLVSFGFFFLHSYEGNISSRNLTIFEEIKLKIGELNNIEIKENNGFRWIKNKYSILVPATENFYINKQNDKHLEFEEVPNLFEKESSIVENVLKEKGFVLSSANSSANFSDRTFYDYIQSYQKNNDLCVARINPDDLGFYQFSFSCGNYLDEAYEEQLPFLKALELKDKKTIVGIKNQKRDYYEISIGAVRGGSTAILKKENNTYRVLFIGQEAPNCSLIEKENIPNEVLSSIGDGNCFTDNGDYKKKIKFLQKS